MFDDLELPKKSECFPRNLEKLSVSELAQYVKDLESEIARVKQNMIDKKESQDAAASIFKS